jgi:hypothetical protein
LLASSSSSFSSDSLPGGVGGVLTWAAESTTTMPWSVSVSASQSSIWSAEVTLLWHVVVELVDRQESLGFSDGDQLLALLFVFLSLARFRLLLGSHVGLLRLGRLCLGRQVCGALGTALRRLTTTTVSSLGAGACWLGYATLRAGTAARFRRRFGRRLGSRA